MGREHIFSFFPKPRNGFAGFARGMPPSTAGCAPHFLLKRKCAAPGVKETFLILFWSACFDRSLQELDSIEEETSSNQLCTNVLFEGTCVKFSNTQTAMPAAAAARAKRVIVEGEAGQYNTDRAVVQRCRKLFITGLPCEPSEAGRVGKGRAAK